MLSILFVFWQNMSGRAGGRTGGRRGGGGGRNGGGRGGGNIPMTQAELENMLQRQLNVALAAFLAAQQTLGNTNQVQSGCTYKKFMDCKPHNFNGTEGAVGLLRWLEKVESVFSMCSCPAGDRVKYASATLEGQALTWWNSTTQTLGIGEAHAMPWAEFVQLLKNEYCPRDEIQKLEHEVWNHKMVGSAIEAYTARHNELAVLCPDLHAPEYRRIEHYVAGLVPEIAGLVVAGNLTVYSEVVRSAHRLTNMKVAEGV